MKKLCPYPNDSQVYVNFIYHQNNGNKFVSAIDFNNLDVSKINLLDIMRFSGKLFGFLFIIILSGCAVSKNICPCEAPEIVRIAENVIEINAQIILTDTAGLSGMKVKIWLITPNHATLPANFSADYYYMRSSNLSRSAFEGKFATANSNFINGIMILEANNAPPWGKDELVDVAVHLTDKRGRIHFIMKGAVPVQSANK